LGPAGVLDPVALLLFDALGTGREALLGHPLNGVLLALGHGQALHQEVALGQPLADDAFVARAPESDETREDHGEEENPHVQAPTIDRPGGAGGPTESVQRSPSPETVQFPRIFGWLAGPGDPWYQVAPMRENIRLLSSAGTGYSYYTKKNKRTQTNKLEVKKYDPVVRKHVAFKEAKMPPHSK